MSVVYLLTEGPNDVAFLARLLKRRWGAAQIRYLEDLDDGWRAWLPTWPFVQENGKTVIDQLAVAAPVFWRTSDGTLVLLRNGGGISKLAGTLDVDWERIQRSHAPPDAIGIVLDSDGEVQADRFAEWVERLKKLGLAPAVDLGGVSEGPPRVGVFALPHPGRQGILEDLLLDLGDAVYGALTSEARQYVDSCYAHSESEPSRWRELRSTSGKRKATVSAMTAILKPSRGTIATVRDDEWISDTTMGVTALAPCIEFLSALLAPTAAAS